MMFRLILFVLLMGSLAPLQSQDTLHLTDDTKIACQITEIRPESITYLLPAQPYTFYSVQRNLVRFARYAGGKTDTFNYTIAAQLITAPGKRDSFASPAAAYQVGFTEGYQRYHPYQERITGAASVFLIYYGWIPPLAMSMSKVKPNKINDPLFLSSRNEDYRRGYLQGASKRRREAVWSSYGIGLGVTAAAVGAIILVTY